MSWQLKAISMLGGMLSSGKNEINKESQKFTSVTKKILIYPIRLIATFIFAPFLLIKTVLDSDSSIGRKFIAIFGLALAGLATYFLTTFVTISLAAIIKANLGWFSLISYGFGVFFTAWVSILIQIGIFNFISTLILKINQQEVLQYLNKLADGKG